MQHQKKELEILLIHYIRECCDILPEGKLLPSESPDFILKINKKINLGIELTRLNPLNVKTPDEKELEQHKLHNVIINRAKNIFTRSSDKNLFVKFLFSDKIKINPESSLVLSVRITNLVRNSVQDKKHNSFFCESLRGNKLPKELDELLIIHDPQLTTSVWECSNNLGISENIIEDIRETILKKDEKLKIYQKRQLNKYWLIITTDRLRGPKSNQLKNTIMNVSFHSCFERVFLLDLMRAECHELV